MLHKIRGAERPGLGIIRRTLDIMQPRGSAQKVPSPLAAACIGSHYADWHDNVPRFDARQVRSAL